MKTKQKNQRSLLSLALLVSLSATALFVASADEKETNAFDVAAAAATAAPPAAVAEAVHVPTSPVIELPPTTTLAGDPTVDADKALSDEAPLEPG